MHISNQVPFITLMNFVLKISLQISALKCEIKLQLIKTNCSCSVQAKHHPTPYTHIHTLQSLPYGVHALRQKDTILPMDLLSSRMSSAWPLSQENGRFSQEQGWRGTRPLSSCSLPFLPFLLQEDWPAGLWTRALPQSPQLSSMPLAVPSPPHRKHTPPPYGSNAKPVPAAQQWRARIQSYPTDFWQANMKHNKCTVLKT